MKKVDKHFISEIDKIFQKFDAEHPKSKSQLAEISKYQRVFELRDNVESPLRTRESDKDVAEL